MKIVAKINKQTNTISFYVGGYYYTTGYLTVFFDDKTNNIVFYDKTVYSFNPDIIGTLNAIESIVLTTVKFNNTGKKAVMDNMVASFGPIEIKAED